jgi:hypothetical protein
VQRVEDADQVVVVDRVPFDVAGADSFAGDGW